MTKCEAELDSLAKDVIKFLDMHDRFVTEGTWNEFEKNNLRKKLIKDCWKIVYKQKIPE